MNSNKSRSKNAALNTIWAIFTQLVVVCLSLLSRKIFLDYLGTEMLGVNSLFSDVLMLFSVADLGLGTAIVFSMYRPVAENDDIKVKSLLLFFRTIYRYVIIAVIAISICFIPFLNYLKTNLSFNELFVYYLFYQICNVIEYIWVYRENYVIAIQRERELTRWNLVYNIVVRIGQMVVIVIYHSFIAYLVIGIICVVLKKLLVNAYIVGKYPITRLHDARPLSKEERQSILKKATAVLITRIGNLMINQTDSLIVSYLISVIEWGFASNYLVIKKSIFIVTEKIHNAVIPSMGNLLVEDNKKHHVEVFLKYDLLNAWMYTFFFVAFLCLSNPFVALFFGEHTVLPFPFVFVFFFASFVDGLRAPVSAMREAGGSFEKDKWFTIVAAVVNIVVSIPLALIIGLTGVYVGTICAMIVLHMSRTIILLGNKGYDISAAGYIMVILRHIIIGLLLAGFTYWAASLFNSIICNPYMLFLTKCVLVAIIPNILWLAIYAKNKSVQELFRKIGVIKKCF